MSALWPCSPRSFAPLVCVLTVVALLVPAHSVLAGQPDALRDQIKPEPGVQTLKAVAIKVTGRVRWAPVTAARTDTDAWKPVKVGQELTQGAQVMTDLGSEAIFRIGDEEPYTELKVGRLSLVSLDLLFKTSQRKASLITLGRGSVMIAVDEGGLESDFVVDTPVATLSKRGTEDLFLRYTAFIHEIEAGILKTGSGMGYLYRKRDGRGQAFGRGQSTNLNLPPLTETLRRGRLVNFLDPMGLRGWDVIFNFREGNTGFGALVAAGGPEFLAEIGRLPTAQIMDEVLAETEAQLVTLLDAFGQTAGAGQVGQPLTGNFLQTSLRAVRLLRQVAETRRLQQAGEEGSFGVRYPFDLSFWLSVLQGINLPTSKQWGTKGSMLTGRSTGGRSLAARRPGYVFNRVMANLAARRAAQRSPLGRQLRAKGWHR